MQYCQTVLQHIVTCLPCTDHGAHKSPAKQCYLCCSTKTFWRRGVYVQFQLHKLLLNKKIVPTYLYIIILRIQRSSIKLNYGMNILYTSLNAITQVPNNSSSYILILHVSNNVYIYIEIYISMQLINMDNNSKITTQHVAQNSTYLLHRV